MCISYWRESSFLRKVVLFVLNCSKMVIIRKLRSIRMDYNR